MGATLSGSGWRKGMRALEVEAVGVMFSRPAAIAGEKSEGFVQIVTGGREWWFGWRGKKASKTPEFMVVWWGRGTYEKAQLRDVGGATAPSGLLLPSLLRS